MGKISYFGSPKRFIDNLYQHSREGIEDAAYIDEEINYLKIDLHHPHSRKVVGVRVRHPVFRIKCKKNNSYRIFYTWDRNNIVVLEIDIRDERTYKKDMIKKLESRVKIAEEEGLLK